MELDWTTFILEIINFFVLLWILQRFFYKPVQNVIAKRKAAIDRTLAQAQATQTQADELKKKYEERLSAWEEERDKARQGLDKEIAEERARRMDALKDALEKEREKSRVLEQRRLGEIERNLQKKAVDRGGRFATRLLARFADHDLEKRLLLSLCDDLGTLPPEQVERLKDAYRRDGTAKVVVTSAFPLGKDAQALLRSKVGSLIGREADVQFTEDRGLIAGVRVDLASWVLRANLRDELGYFEEAEIHAA